MGERYLITGVQLALLVIDKVKQSRKELVDNIMNTQYVGDTDNDVEDDCKEIHLD